MVPAGELAQALALKPSTLSVYVAILVRAGLVRQAREGRFIRYGIDLEHVGALVEFLVNDCCRGRPEVIAGLSTSGTPDRIWSRTPLFNVLFICTGNSARSIFAEAILRDKGQGRFRAFSAGTNPYSNLNPFALEVLRFKGHNVADLKPKCLSNFLDASSPKMDFVFTVCDHAANEECPPLPGQPVSAHWGMVDPVRATGSEAEKALAFHQAYGMMLRRLQAFVALPFESLGRLSLQKELDEIGRKVGLQVH